MISFLEHEYSIVFGSTFSSTCIMTLKLAAHTTMFLDA